MPEIGREAAVDATGSAILYSWARMLLSPPPGGCLFGYLNLNLFLEEIYRYTTFPGTSVPPQKWLTKSFNNTISYI